jgi:hypothetical protein
MNKFVYGLFFSILFASSASAAVISRDWKTPDDGLLTYDTVNKREWLDLTETILARFSGSILDEKYQSLLTETFTGGLFEGFKVAERSDVIALAESAGIDTSTTEFSVNQSSTLSLITLLEPTLASSSNIMRSVGVIDELDTSCGCRSLGDIAIRNTSAGVWFFPEESFGIDRGLLYIGAFLYRDAIPEPTATILIVSSIFATLSCRCSHR